MKRMIICQNCNKEFYSPSWNYKQKYCSNECKYKMISILWSKKKWKTYIHLHKDKPERTCLICLKTFIDYDNRKKKPKIYCSRKCWNERRILNKCEHCWNDIKSYHWKKYCSRECSKNAMVWEKSSGWIDWKSLERDRARLWPELKKWRLEVYKRDDFTCKWCWYKWREIHAHHIIHWADDETKRFEVSNWKTLCIHCHWKEHWMDFTRKSKNKCPDCWKEITIQSKRCRKCATINQWNRIKNKPVISD